MILSAIAEYSLEGRRFIKNEIDVETAD